MKNIDSILKSIQTYVTEYCDRGTNVFKNNFKIVFNDKFYTYELFYFVSGRPRIFKVHDLCHISFEDTEIYAVVPDNSNGISMIGNYVISGTELTIKYKNIINKNEPEYFQWLTTATQSEVEISDIAYEVLKCTNRIPLWMPS